jgi:hypothetical protein
MKNSRNMRFLMSTLSAALMVLAWSGASRADVVFEFDPVNTFSGNAPTGTLSATFSDVSGGVQLVITSNLGSGENVATKNDGFYFNVEPGLAALGHMSISLVSFVGFNSTPSLAQGEDLFKPDGTGGLYDLNLTWAKQGGFTNGQSETLLITTSSGTISAADFNYLSTGGSPTSYYAAVHVQNTPGGSAWVGGTQPPPLTPGAPEPSTMAIAGLGALGFLGYGLRRHLKK